ncbi:isochorismate synthase [Brucella sp. 2716]|uniref:isochorismate synthase n=1 Tax=Brucella sp. 2716 TaxID=2975052 RepID=UPI00217D0977|nr:isochorismate synthase MenF [Brucella sp. 2716]UWF60537.1 isochorismate synthase MenF [Brucella sp. 2716]
MRTSALKYPTSDADHLIENNIDFSFASGNLKLAASGMREVIATPAIGGSNPDSTFQRAIAQAFERAARAGQRNPIVVGAIPFDPGEPSCLYVPEEMDWQEREPASGVSASAMPQLAGQRSVPDEAGFKHAVEHAIINFRLSDVRKAVLSVMRELTFADDIDVDAMLANLRAQNHDGYQFRVPLPGGGALVGVSPELLIHKDKGKIVSNPLAGSAKRMADPEADRKNADRLAKSEKDHYEHRLVIEDIRARLQPICTELDIPERPSLIHTAALWHLSTRIEGRLHDPDMTALQLACLIHPTPAVCGFPTERARRLIRFVEPFERGLFTGMVGWSDAEGNGEWVVTIRCGTVKGNLVRLFAGAGIVEASSPDSEWAEVQTKLGTMLRACGLSA